jgi:GAF domain-containing protein
MEPIEETRRALEALDGQVGAEPLGPMLRELAGRAQDIVPQCVGMSLAINDEGLSFTLVATDREIAALDAVQYLDGGPCVASAHEEQSVTTRADELDEEGRWQLYARASAAEGVASSLTLPIERNHRVVGSINLYGSTPEAFDGHHGELAKALGASAREAVTNADLSFSTRPLSVRAPEQIEDQDAIDLALGIIASNQSVDIPTARERLIQAAARAGVTEAEAAKVLTGAYPDSGKGRS